MKRWIVILLAVMTTPALGLIKVKFPVSEMYEGSQSVIIGTVTKVNAEIGSVEAAAKTMKGEGLGEVVRFKIEGQDDALKNTKEGSPFVLMLGERAAANALHLADRWLLPLPEKGKKAFFSVRNVRAEFTQSYPSTTSALVRHIQDLAAGKSNMLNAYLPGMFKGEVKEIGKIDAKGVNKLQTIPGQPPTIVATGEGSPRYFTIKDGKLAPAAETSPAPVFPEGGLITGDFGEDDKSAVITLSDDNITRAGANDAAPADFFRLTGERLATYFKDQKPLAGATACALDANGDGRIDVFINTATRPILLLNRGYGAFFMCAELHKVIKPEALGPKSIWTAADVDGDKLDDLVILSDNGTVSAIMNPKPAE